MKKKSKKPKIWSKTLAQVSYFSFFIPFLISLLVVKPSEWLNHLLPSFVGGAVISIIASIVYMWTMIEEKDKYNHLLPILRSVTSQLTPDNWYLSNDDKTVTRTETVDRIEFSFHLKGPFGKLTYDKKTQSFSKTIFNSFFKEHLIEESEEFFDKIKSFAILPDLGNSLETKMDVSNHILEESKEVIHLNEDILLLENTLEEDDIESWHILTSVKNDLEKVLTTFSKLSWDNQKNQYEPFLEMIVSLQSRISKIVDKQQKKQIKQAAYLHQLLKERS